MYNNLLILVFGAYETVRI